MAAVATMTTIRRPFQPLGESDLRRLSNMKNFQNAIVPPTMENSLKRPHQPSGPDDYDQENVDPKLSLHPSKKSKSGLEDIIQSKPAQFMFTNGGGKTTAPTARPKRPLPVTSRYTLVSKPALTVSTSSTRAETARIPAGRSPVKRNGLMSHRRKVSRINPPSFPNGGGQGVSLPFSLDAALSGTVSSYTPKVATKVPLMLDNSIPASWKFTIYEETEGQQKDTILAHSTNILDISDDECGLGAKDYRGKENIPPTDCPIVTEVPASRRNKMNNLPRTPLGSLNPAQFYTEGFDAYSHFLIPSEKEDEL